MGDGGKVTISTFVKNEHVVLAIADEGSGIPPKVLQNNGTPFFTTKEQGTRLGLSTCFNICKRHNADIDIDTGPGGTTFYVKFPVEKRGSWQYKTVIK